MESQQIEKLVLKVSRKSLQGGVPNERYPEKLLRDSRLTNHIPTDAVMVWKKFDSAGNDSKFTDIKSQTSDAFAEGKCINQKRGVCLRPSVDTGGGRGFRQENLDACFVKNSFYFLYETTIITETHIQFDIYWIPIAVICKWYSEHGNKGQITYNKFKACISQCEIVQTEETRD